MLRAGILVLIAAAVVGCHPETQDTARVPELGPVVLLASDSGLYDVQDLAAGAGGDVWVLTAHEPFLTHFAANGTLIARVGRAGRGPRELSNPRALIVSTGGDAITVWDPGNRKLVIFDSAGDVTHTSRFHLDRGGFVRADIRDVAFANPFHLAKIRNRYIVAEYSGSVTAPSDMIQSRVVAADSVGATVDTVVDFERDVWRDETPAAIGRALVDVPLWTVCRSENVVIFEPFGPSIQRYDESGRLLSTDTVPLTRKELTEADIRPYLRHQLDRELRERTYDSAVVDAQIDKILTHRKDLFGRTAPLAVSIMCDPSQGVWLEQFSTTDDPLGFGREWISVAGDGATRRVRFPRGFVPMKFLEGRALGVLTDSLGLQHVSWVAYGGS